MNARDDMGAVPPGQGDVATHSGALLRLACEGWLRTWNLSGKELVPVVEGGMGMGVSAGGLAQRFFSVFGPARAGCGPDADHMLLAAVTNCLSASLLFALQKFKQYPGTLAPPPCRS